MNTPAIRPRPDQILELSRGIQLPLPKIDEVHLELIAEILALAFQDILHQSPTTVASGNEAEVTALLVARLNYLIGHKPIWGQLVNCVVRGVETCSYDGSHLEKRPDVSIFFTDRSRNFPLIAEAKLIDKPTGKTENLYCEKGVRRFLNGEYAWGTCEAFMLAYVRDSSTIESCLTPFLSKSAGRNAVQYRVEEHPTAAGSGTFDLARSKHSRSFVYGHQEPSNNAPGSVELWHLWIG